ncbi:hypothetical protein ABIE86_001047 [Bradyrhizobium diazoefficiens]
MKNKSREAQGDHAKSSGSNPDEIIKEGDVAHQA